MFLSERVVQEDERKWTDIQTNTLQQIMEPCMGQHHNNAPKSCTVLCCILTYLTYIKSCNIKIYYITVCAVIHYVVVLRLFAINGVKLSSFILIYC